MTKYKIRYDRESCIGAGTCIAASGKYWEMDEEDKAVLKGSKLIGEIYEREFPEEDLEEVLDSARVCPVFVIEIYKLEDSGEWVKVEN